MFNSKGGHIPPFIKPQKKMYKHTINYSTKIVCNDATSAESIEEQMRKVTQSKEPIDSSAPLLYTEKSDGVQAGYDIRTDRFEVAIDAADRITGALEAQRQNASEAAEPTKQEPTKQE